MDKYIKMKFRLIENMDKRDLVIYNRDDKILKEGFKNLSIIKKEFSITHQTKHFYQTDKHIYF